MEEYDQHANAKQAFWAVVPAAGIGRRMNSAIPKQYLRLNGLEVLAWTLQRLQSLSCLQGIILVLHPQDEYYKTYLAERFPAVRCVPGGNERVHSVLAGLQALSEHLADNDWVLVHDAVRPCVALSDLSKLTRELADDAVGGILASPVKDTLKMTDQEGFIKQTLNRENCWLAATPQMFRFQLLQQALMQALEDGAIVTDEASALERLNYPVRVLSGRSDNIKITSEEDLSLAEFILTRQGADSAYAVGQEVG